MFCNKITLSALIMAVSLPAFGSGTISLPQGAKDEVDFLDNATPEEIAAVYDVPYTNEDLTKFYAEHPKVLARSDKKEKLEIHVSRATKDMTVSVDGQVKYHWPVTIGLKGLGLTKPYKGHPYGREYRHPDHQFRGAVLPYVVKVVGGEFIHGTHADAYLGKAHSHGCVRLRMENAQTLYNLVGQYGLGGTWIVIE
jgi:lipoprotein-anchoring transpeptidase ErfK/SrfK